VRNRSIWSHRAPGRRRERCSGHGDGARGSVPRYGARRGIRWPHKPEDRDVLYFLAQSFRARIARELPIERTAISEQQKQFAHLAKGLLKDLAAVSFEIAQLVVSSDEKDSLPDWFVVEIVRDLPRLAEKRDGAQS